MMPYYHKTVSHNESFMLLKGVLIRTPPGISYFITGCSLPKILRPCSGLIFKGQWSNETIGNEHPGTQQNIPAEEFSVSHNIPNHVRGRCERCSNRLTYCQEPEFNTHECAND
jgi:hypothetical protein